MPQDPTLGSDGNLELVSKLGLGMLVHRSEITTKSFLLTADYIAFRTILIEECAAIPRSLAGLLVASPAVETEAAEAVTAEANKPSLLPH